MRMLIGQARRREGEHLVDTFRTTKSFLTLSYKSPTHIIWCRRDSLTWESDALNRRVDGGSNPPPSIKQSTIQLNPYDL